MIEQIEQPEKWYQNSILFKLSIITLLILLLLIPQSWIQDLIVERQYNQEQNVSNVTEQWSGSQLVQGPVLVVPYKSPSVAGKPTIINYLYLLPQTLQIKAGINAEPFKKGLVNLNVFNAKVDLKGSFNQPDLIKQGIDPALVMYDKAKLIFSLSDLKGLKNNPGVNIQGQVYQSEPVTEQGSIFDNGMLVNFSMPHNGTFAFDFTMNVKGSNDLEFLHLGKTTDVEVTSNWKSPLYIGGSMPDSRVVDNDGFKAKWHMLYYNRPFPQQWVNDLSVLKSKKEKLAASFGVKLQITIDDYRKVTRTAKYATLIILLTFVSLLLTELIRKQRIHLFNYTLIGAAMIVFYLLLLSFSEKIGYNISYLIASVSTIGLIAAFTASLFHNRMAAALFALILAIFYGFIFIIIQLEDFALLVGSIALFAIVAALMYFSRKINWDKH
jgi:inner membrane protein